MIKYYCKILAIELEIQVYCLSLPLFKYDDFLQGKSWSFN